jgi:hypothetical protein
MNTRKVTKFEDMPTLGGWTAVTWDNRTIAERMTQEAQQARRATDARADADVLARWREYLDEHPSMRDSNGNPREYDRNVPADWFREEG